MKNTTTKLRNPATTTIAPDEYYDYYWEYYYEDYDGPFTINYDLFISILTITADIDTVISVIGLITNLLHFWVLTRKEMLKHFFYVLMLGICIFDVIMISAGLIYVINGQLFPHDNCLTSPSLTYIFIDWLSQAIGDIARRAAIYLALFMAFCRCLTVYFPMSNWIQRILNPRTSLIIILITGLICGGIDGSYWYRYQLWDLNETDGDYDCFGVLLNKSIPRFEYSYPSEASEIQALSRDIDAFLHVLISVLYIILTLILVIKLIKIRRKNHQLSKSEGTNNTTKLVLVMAILFSVSEFLNGAYAIIQHFFWQRNRDVQFVASHVIFMTETLLTFNSTLHCFFCIFLSSHYRDTVKNVLCRGKNGVFELNSTSSKFKATILVKSKTSGGGSHKD